GLHLCDVRSDVSNIRLEPCYSRFHSRLCADRGHRYSLHERLPREELQHDRRAVLNGGFSGRRDESCPTPVSAHGISTTVTRRDRQSSTPSASGSPSIQSTSMSAERPAPRSSPATSSALRRPTASDSRRSVPSVKRCAPRTPVTRT